jgi:hypothetical protein
LLKKLVMSVLTVGSEFSQRMRPADVCMRSMLQSPVSSCLISGPTSERISPVMR